MTDGCGFISRNLAGEIPRISSGMIIQPKERVRDLTAGEQPPSLCPVAPIAPGAHPSPQDHHNPDLGAGSVQMRFWFWGKARLPPHISP